MVSSTTTLDGIPFNEEMMIYGGQDAAQQYNDQQYNEMIAKIREHTTGNDSSNFNFNPLYQSTDIFGEAAGAYNVGKYGYGYAKYGFDVKLKGDYAIIKGARSEFALKGGIKGTRYALKNADKYSEVFSFVEPSTAVKSAFNPKTVGGKLGYAGIVVGAGWDTYNNIHSSADGKKIGADIAVDVAFGAGGIAASVGAGAFIGSIVPGPGTVVGAIGGFIVGVGYTIGTEVWEPGGTSIEDRFKEGLYYAIK